ncbi:MAG: peptidase D,D-carboxypeptidase [Acidobacteriaceae bacterium]|jgi:peptidoglycan L-alanyl-D-glutamate endopeptidase CwlK|nr:peptidase D,D-carboxypeptidase [Acidobacteriaceae bacterium]
MDARSEKALAGVFPELADKVRAAAAKLEKEQTFLLVVSGLRTAAEQQALYAQGRSVKGHIVTNARAGFSMHNYGLAVDVVPYQVGEKGALNWNPATPQFQRMVAAMKGQELEWGGDWKGGLGDFDHFQMSGLPVSPSLAMRTDYGVGPKDLSTIWEKAEEKSYAV